MKTDPTLRHDNRDKDERIRELEAQVEALMADRKKYCADWWNVIGATAAEVKA